MVLSPKGGRNEASGGFGLWRAFFLSRGKERWSMEANATGTRTSLPPCTGTNSKYGHLKEGWNVLATRPDGGLCCLRINDRHGELRYALEIPEGQMGGR